MLFWRFSSPLFLFGFLLILLKFSQQKLSKTVHLRYIFETCICGDVYILPSHLIDSWAYWKCLVKYIVIKNFENRIPLLSVFLCHKTSDDILISKHCTQDISHYFLDNFLYSLFSEFWPFKLILKSYSSYSIFYLLDLLFDFLKEFSTFGLH